jgi:hypothetical protein
LSRKIDKTPTLRRPVLFHQTVASASHANHFRRTALPTQDVSQQITIQRKTGASKALRPQKFQEQIMPSDPT